MEKLIFNNNDEMPALGLGTWNSTPGEVYDAVKTAIQLGYRHIDCAAIYQNEKEIGQAISDSIAQGMVSRADLWITSKLWNNHHHQADVIPALNQTLADLQLNYVDLYLIHWAVATKKDVILPQTAEDMVSLEEIPIAMTWKAMEEAVDLGLAKHIGVSNFGIKSLGDLLTNAKVIPEMNQVESHPYLQQEELLSYCRSHKIHVTAYSPLGSSNRPDELKMVGEPRLLDDPIICKIALENQLTPAQVLISWGLQRGISVIPKSVNAHRLLENFKAGQCKLSENNLYEISKLNKNHRYVSGLFWLFEGGPYTLENVYG